MHAVSGTTKRLLQGLQGVAHKTRTPRFLDLTSLDSRNAETEDEERPLLGETGDTSDDAGPLILRRGSLSAVRYVVFGCTTG